MHLSRLFTPALISFVVCACATAPAVTPEPNSDAARTQAILAGAKRWTGSLNPTQSYAAAAVTTTRQKAYGSVELTVSPNRPTVTHVRLTVSVPVEPGLTNLGWAIHPGSCGSGAPPMMAAGTFPTIVLSSNGRGSVDDDIGFTVPESGSYHVNVFRGAGTQLTDVITCATLRRES
jgi:hypothetical protein